MSRSLVVGLTGGIGSGKSAAAEEFARLGATVVDTDSISHELTRAGGSALGPIRQQFGAEYLDAEGALDRAKMRALVFADAAARKKLEAVLHPLIRAESERQIASATGSYVVHVVPLLIESPGYRERVSRVLVLDCPDALQLERVRSRGGLTPEAVHAIIRSQASRAARIAAADDVIDNSGSLAALHKRVAELHQQFTDWLAKKGIEHELVKSHGQDYVVWDESKGDVVKEFMEGRGGAECKGKVAASKSAPGRC